MKTIIVDLAMNSNGFNPVNYPLRTVFNTEENLKEGDILCGNFLPNGRGNANPYSHLRVYQIHDKLYGTIDNQGNLDSINIYSENIIELKLGGSKKTKPICYGNKI